MESHRIELDEGAETRSTCGRMRWRTRPRCSSCRRWGWPRSTTSPWGRAARGRLSCRDRRLPQPRSRLGQAAPRRSTSATRRSCAATAREWWRSQGALRERARCSSAATRSEATYRAVLGTLARGRDRRRVRRGGGFGALSAAGAALRRCASWASRSSRAASRSPSATFPASASASLGLEPRTQMIDWAQTARTGRFEPRGDTYDYEARMAEVALPALAITIGDDDYTPPTAAGGCTASSRAPGSSRGAAPRRSAARGVGHFSWVKTPHRWSRACAPWSLQHRCRSKPLVAEHREALRSRATPHDPRLHHDRHAPGFLRADGSALDLDVDARGDRRAVRVRARARTARAAHARRARGPLRATLPRTRIARCLDVLASCGVVALDGER